ncbi:MAG: N,N-dimethylformamidase beta subunit family domain-containing protein [Parvibaculaceae bacterium]
MSEANIQSKPAFAWSPKDWPSERPSLPGTAEEAWLYTDRFSYFPGETVQFHVSGTVAAASLEIVRDGHAPKSIHRVDALRVEYHPTPENAYAEGCNWPVAHKWVIPDAAASGFHLVILRATLSNGEIWEREHFFVIKAPKERRNRIVLVLPTSTLLAYNDWGGANHYRGLGNDPRDDAGSPVSSTRRPIGRGMLRKPAGAPREANHLTLPIGGAPRYASYEWARLNGYCRHHADAGWATYDRLFVIWAEAQGYSLDYLTQHDLHFSPDALDGYSCVVVVGHDEYWSWKMRDTMDAFLDAGGCLARLGGNYQWQVRLSEDGTRQYCYRLPALDPQSKATPHLATTVWEAKCVGRPGATTIGLNGLGGIYTRYGVATPRSSGGFTIYRPDHWAFAGTDLYYGDVLGAAPTFLAAFEVDSVEYTFRRGLPYPTFEDGAPETLEILGMCPAVRGEENRFGGAVPIGGPEAEVYNYNAELGSDLPDYVHEGGMRGAGMIAAFTRGKGEVFNGGSTEWPFALSVGDPQVCRIVRNVLDRFSDRRRS